MKQLSLFEDVQFNQDCKIGLHTYHNSKRLNLDNNRICKYCGEDSIDWKRIHLKNIQDLKHTTAYLKTEKVRYEMWTKEIDELAINHALRKGSVKLREAAFKRLKQSIGAVYKMPDGIKRPYRDGYQTPYSGNIIYYAQHAVACCCRKCIEYWHGIPNGRDLNEQELEYFTNLVMNYTKARVPEIKDEGIYVPPKRKLNKQGELNNATVE